MAAAKRWLCGILAAAAAAAVLGPRYREDRYSCHLCRGLKEVQSTKFLGWVIRQEDVDSNLGAVGADHVHDWWSYSYFYANGALGCLGSGVACKTDGRFKDEQRPKSIVSANR